MLKSLTINLYWTYWSWVGSARTHFSGDWSIRCACTDRICYDVVLDLASLMSEHCNWVHSICWAISASVLLKSNCDLTRWLWTVVKKDIAQLRRGLNVESTYTFSLTLKCNIDLSELTYELWEWLNSHMILPDVLFDVIRLDGLGSFDHVLITWWSRDATKTS